MELFEAIRRDRRGAGTVDPGVGGAARVHRRTVRQALERALPPPRKPYPRRRCPAIEAYAAVVDGWLLADVEAPRKQRHTARRIWQRLVAEQGATLAEVTVSRYVARRRAELGLDRVEVMVPQTHPVSAEAEVDFGEFYTTIAGAWTKSWMFVLRGRDRTESERFIALRSYYSFDSFFCTPGKERAHEKGGVEGEIGRFRRRLWSRSRRWLRWRS